MIRNRLSAIMGEKRVKMIEVARSSGLTYATVHAVYHDRVKVIAFKTLERFCKALNCQPGDILVYVPDDQPQGG